MAEAEILLPTDEELPPEAVKLLETLPPLNIFRAVAGLPRSLRPFLELGGSILGANNLKLDERQVASDGERLDEVPALEHDTDVACSESTSFRLRQTRDAPVADVHRPTVGVVHA